MPKREAPDLFTAILTDDAIIAHIEATAATAIQTSDKDLHFGFYGPERLRQQAVQLAITRLQHNRQIPKELPQAVRDHITRITEQAEVADVTLRALTKDNAELEDEIRRLTAFINGETLADEDERDEETLDEECDEVCEIDDELEEEEEELEANAHAEDSVDYGRQLRDLALLTAERDRRNNASYSRVRELESHFTQRYGAAAEILRNILVSALMVETPAGQFAIIERCAIDSDAIDEACFYIGPGAANHAEYIAQARLAEHLPAPYTVDFVPHTFEQMPRLHDGVARRYFLCPCCNQRFGNTHICHASNCTSKTNPYLQRLHNGERIATRCAYSTRSERCCTKEGVIPFGRSILAYRNRRSYFVSPELGHRILASAVKKRYPNSADLSVTFDEESMHFSETLPEPLRVGTPVGELLEIHSVKRIPRKATAEYGRWWFRDDRPRTNEMDTVVEYATAYDVIAYRGRQRSAPTVLERHFGGQSAPTIISAIVGDRIGSSFGPRVERVSTSTRKVSDTNEHLTRTVRDGDVYKTLHLTVDPIASYDDAQLTAALLERLEEYREPRGTIGIALTREIGAHGVHRLLQEAEQYDDDTSIHSEWRTDRFVKGYSDAVSYLAEKIHDLIRCPECGVLETCHTPDEPIGACDRKRKARHSSPSLNAPKMQMIEDAPQLALI